MDCLCHVKSYFRKIFFLERWNNLGKISDLNPANNLGAIIKESVAKSLWHLLEEYHHDREHLMQAIGAVKNGTLKVYKPYFSLKLN